MQVFDKSNSIRWSFVFAHPDDELAIVCWMRELIASGASVDALWLHSTPVREAESRAVGHLIGLRDEQMRFMAFPDGDFVDHLDELVQVTKGFFDETRPDRVVTMAYEQGHLDHDSAHFACRENCPNSLFEFPMYWAYYSGLMHLNIFARGSGDEFQLSLEHAQLKRQVLMMYPSQTIRRNVFWYGVYRRLIGKRLDLDSRELLRKVWVKDYGRPIHKGRVGKKVYRCANWHRWRNAMRNYEAKKQQKEGRFLYE